MIGLFIEFSIVLAIFGFLWRRQVHDRERARRVAKPAQLQMDFPPTRKTERAES